MSEEVQKPGALASSLRLILVLVLFGLLVEGLRLPSSVPESADPKEFSEARARKHLESVAFEIHPTGSMANKRVRLYLEGTLKSLGLEVDSSTWGMGIRGQRFALVVDDGVVTHAAIEAPGQFDVSSAEAILAAL